MPLKAYIADEEPLARERLTIMINRFLSDELTLVGEGGEKEKS